MEQMRAGSALRQNSSKIIDMLRKLETALAQYDQVLFFSDEGNAGRPRSIADVFCRSRVVQAAKKKLLVVLAGQLLNESSRCDCWNLDSAEAAALRRLYLLYEFSDNFQMISLENKNFATLFHFVDAGILDLEDVFSALIH